MTGLPLFLLLPALQAQYILAGQHGPGDYYSAPDVTVSTISGGGKTEHPIDLNQDGTDDFLFTTYSEFGFGTGVAGVTIGSSDLMRCQVAVGAPDTCFPNPADSSVFRTREVARRFHPNDTIDDRLTWGTTLYQTLLYSEWAFQQPICWGGLFQNDPAGDFIGVRICNPNDTVLGWIRVEEVQIARVRLKEMVCQRHPMGISEAGPTVRIYPVPAGDQVLVDTPLPRFDLIVINSDGKEIQRQNDLSGQVTISTGNLPSGLYFFRIEAGDRSTGKVILKR